MTLQPDIAVNSRASPDWDLNPGPMIDFQLLRQVIQTSRGCYVLLCATTLYYIILDYGVSSSVIKYFHHRNRINGFYGLHAILPSYHRMESIIALIYNIGWHGTSCTRVVWLYHTVILPQGVVISQEQYLSEIINIILISIVSCWGSSLFAFFVGICLTILEVLNRTVTMAKMGRQDHRQIDESMT